MAHGKLNISRLYSGGLITNYFCSSRCGHCLYGCGPEWKKDYISPEKTRLNLEKVKSLGCSSVHIGGGEPMLRPELLIEVLKTAESVGVGIEYVETNSSWFKDDGGACRTLEKLMDSGLRTLLVSISPFHNEFIPFCKVKGVIRTCNKLGMGVFPWVDSFIEDISSFDDEKSHLLEEYENKFGPGYINSLIHHYGLTMRGRTLKTYESRLEKHGVREILDSNKSGCQELAGLSHFHVDLYGNYIPGLCTGLSIGVEDLGGEVSPKKYPIIAMLHEYGINHLFDHASSIYGFQTRDGYISKCDLCFDIRRFLATVKKISSAELRPEEIYYNL